MNEFQPSQPNEMLQIFVFILGTIIAVMWAAVPFILMGIRGLLMKQAKREADREEQVMREAIADKEWRQAVLLQLQGLNEKLGEAQIDRVD